MIKVSDIKLPVDADQAALIKKAAHEAGIRPEEVREFEIDIEVFGLFLEPGQLHMYNRQVS